MTNPDAPIRLNLGAGSLLMDGFVNVDFVGLPGIDVVWDLDEGPWPFPDECADEIVAFDIFEHVEDPVLFMMECGRVLAPQGKMTVRTGYWKNENAFTDPTHKRFCTERTFDYWCPDTEFGKKYGPAYLRGGKGFLKESVRLDGQELVVVLRRLP